MALQAVNRADQEAVTAAIDDLTFKREAGLRYSECGDLVKGFATETGFDHAADMGELEEVEFEIILLEEGIRPHHHDNSDSVVVVWEHTPLPIRHEYFLAHRPVSGFLSQWHLLRGGDIYPIPRGVVHGFKPRDGVEWFTTTILFVASYPAIEDDDVHYAKLTR